MALPEALAVLMVVAVCGLLMVGYRSPHPAKEPRLGEVLRLPDGSGPWRVVDWKMTDRVVFTGNVLVVEFAGN
jgi:hypothetical protein